MDQHLRLLTPLSNIQRVLSHQRHVKLLILEPNVLEHLLPQNQTSLSAPESLEKVPERRLLMLAM
jgi:hypothetical protein